MVENFNTSASVIPIFYSIMAEKSTHKPTFAASSQSQNKATGLLNSLKPYLDQLDNELSKIELLRLLEAKSKVPKTYIVIGTFSVTFLFLFMNWAASFLSFLIGFVYPAYASFLAIESEDKDDDRQWLTYWVVFSFFTVLEFFADHIMFIFPFYYLAKVLFLIYLFAPQINGAQVLYQSFIRPFFFATQHETARIISEINKKDWKEEMDQVKNMIEDEVKKVM
jgi:receptor expression-enhancing protein 5/6